MNNVDRMKKMRREAGLHKANLRVTYGDTAIRTLWTPLNTTIWSITSVQATGKVAQEAVEIEVVIELRQAPTETINQNIEQIVF